jgi:hypothetical protein
LGQAIRSSRELFPCPADTVIRNPKSGEIAVRLFDERGFYLEVAPSGEKWWRR